MLFLAFQKRLSSLGVSGRYQHGRTGEQSETWDKLIKQVDLEEPTPLLDQVHLACTQRECKPSQKDHSGEQELVRIFDLSGYHQSFTLLGEMSR